MSYVKIIIIFFFFILSSCSKNKEVSENIIQTDSLQDEMVKAYNDGAEALKKGDVIFATKKFNEAEMLFPQSEWAPRAALMSAYAYWTSQYYSSASDELKRFIKIYPNNENLDYAYYLLAMCYYDSIENEKKI